MGRLSRTVGPYACEDLWQGCCTERIQPHKAIPLVNNNANAKTATQNGKTVGEKYFCEFQKKKGFVFQDLPRDTDTSSSSGGGALTCPSIGVPQIGVQQIDVQQIDVLMTVFLGRYDQQRIWTICRISR